MFCSLENSQVKAVPIFGNQVIYENLERHDINIDGRCCNFDTGSVAGKTTNLQKI